MPEHSRTEVIGGAPERHRAPQDREPRVHHVKQRRIFDSEEARQPRVAAVVDGEPGLKAGDVRRGREARQRRPKLVGLGLVLGVIDHQEVPARELQRDVEGAWLGLRPASGRYHDAVTAWKAEPFERDERGPVVGLDHQQDVEAGARIIAVLRSKHT